MSRRGYRGVRGAPRTDACEDDAVDRDEGEGCMDPPLTVRPLTGEIAAVVGAADDDVIKGLRAATSSSLDIRA
jgi:hypothetical protein